MYYAFNMSNVVDILIGLILIDIQGVVTIFFRELKVKFLAYTQLQKKKKKSLNELLFCEITFPQCLIYFFLLFFRIMLMLKNLVKKRRTEIG